MSDFTSFSLGTSFSMDSGSEKLRGTHAHRAHDPACALMIQMSVDIIVEEGHVPNYFLQNPSVFE